MTALGARLRRLRPAGSVGTIARGLRRRADAARDARRWMVAAVLYEEALRVLPGDPALHVQCGHMFKEAGDLARAAEHYHTALQMMPEDADLWLQLGHFYKMSGRYDEARPAYARSQQLRPDWSEPARELAELPDAALPDDAIDGSSDHDRLVPELLPRASPAMLTAPADGLRLHRFGGVPARSRWGVLPTICGVAAVRGTCILTIPVDEIEVLLDGRTVGRGRTDLHPLPGPPPRTKAVFNLWLDLSADPEGLHVLEVRCLSEGQIVRSQRGQVVLAPCTDPATIDGWDGWARLDPHDDRSPEQQLRARPSSVRASRRTLLPRPPQAVLVQRVDQLGDLVVSIPAIRRLRALFPAARLVGLLSPANADLAASLGLFDGIVVADIPEDRDDHRRVLSATAQDALRRTLAPFRFDLAIDLSQSEGTRPILLLSGAPFLCGFRAGQADWLATDVAGSTRGRFDPGEVAPHMNKLVGLVEWLGAMVGDQGAVVPRPDLGRDRLARFGIAGHQRYVVLHTGARLAFSRWPHYPALARRLLDRTDLHIVLMADAAFGPIEQALAMDSGDRLRLIEGRLPFDDLDALLSFATVFVGNDSGPKHLAALRGTPVVSLHMARLNWNEWGQDGIGTIISRHVPCAGCGIHDAPEECGKQFACIVDIAPDEVFAAVERLV